MAVCGRGKFPLEVLLNQDNALGEGNRMENQGLPCCILEWECKEEIRIVIVKFKSLKQHKM